MLGPPGKQVPEPSPGSLVLEPPGKQVLEPQAVGGASGSAGASGNGGAVGEDDHWR